MMIGGFQETSLLDYPEKIAAIIWTIGCNFHCPFCYNRDLVLHESKQIPIDQIFSFLDKRKGKIDAVSISGGEPFLQKDLPSFITEIKEKGFLIKVDTNGSFPDTLESMLDESLIDYVSMDVKAPKKSYNAVAGTSVDIKNIIKSIHIIQEKALDYEFKTTVIPLFHNKQDILDIARWLKGSKRYFIQQFKATSSLLSEALITEKPYSKQMFDDICQEITPYFQECGIRGL
jgi:pyruvate formate lyase activating enzyme